MSVGHTGICLCRNALNPIQIHGQHKPTPITTRTKLREPNLSVRVCAAICRWWQPEERAVVDTGH